MRIFLQDLAIFSREFRRILETQSIRTAEDVRRFVDGKIVLPIGKSSYYIAFDQRKSNGRTEAYAVSYTQSGPFTPLQVRINPHLRYSKIFVRSQKVLPGYSPFDKDCEGNLALEGVVPGTAIPTIAQALEELDLPVTVSSW